MDSQLLLEYLEGRIPFEEWSTRSGIELEASEKASAVEDDGPSTAGFSFPKYLIN